MIEVVTVEDLHALSSIPINSPRARQRAVGMVVDIIARLQRPRAFVAEPDCNPDLRNSEYWTTAYDILTSHLTSELNMTVVDPETIRDIALFCPMLDTLSNAPDALWQLLASLRAVDAVYIPSDDERSKRHMAMERHAKALSIEVVFYRLEVPRRRSITPPQ